MYWHSTCGNGGSYGCRYIHHIDTPCQNIRPTLAATYTDTVCDIELKISDILQENKPTEARKTKLQNLNSLMPLSTHQIKSSFISISCVPVLLRNKKEKTISDILQENKPTEARKTKLQNLNRLMPLSTHQIKSSLISISCLPVCWFNIQ